MDLESEIADYNRDIRNHPTSSFQTQQLNLSDVHVFNGERMECCGKDVSLWDDFKSELDSTFIS